MKSGSCVEWRQKCKCLYERNGITWICMYASMYYIVYSSLGTLSVHPLLCEIADSFPSAALNRNRWDVHRRLLSEEILSSCFSVVNDNLTYDHSSIIGMDREDSSKYDLTYRSKRVRMSTVKSIVRSIVRYKLFEMRTAALDSIATAIQAIHTMDHPPFGNYHNQ